MSGSTITTSNNQTIPDEVQQAMDKFLMSVISDMSVMVNGKPMSEVFLESENVQEFDVKFKECAKLVLKYIGSYIYHKYGADHSKQLNLLKFHPSDILNQKWPYVGEEILEALQDLKNMLESGEYKLNELNIL